jgi:hypothetical protein
MTKVMIVATTLIMFALVLLIGCSGDSGGGGTGPTSNDRVLTGKQFTEVFKNDGNGKNYLYTITEFTDKFGRNCTVVTGDSEKTIALDCEADPLG